MKIDIRFQRACESERIRATRKNKQDFEQRILAMLRSSPVSFSEDVCKYANSRKLELLGVVK